MGFLWSGLNGNVRRRYIGANMGLLTRVQWRVFTVYTHGGMLFMDFCDSGRSLRNQRVQEMAQAKEDGKAHEKQMET